MTRVKHSVAIQAPVHQVFAYASDWQKWPRWFEGVADFRPTTQVSKGNGARYAYKARVMGLWIPVETEIRDFVPDRGWTGVGTKGVPNRAYWRFEPFSTDIGTDSSTGSGIGTRFTYTLEYRLPVPLIGPLLDKLFVEPQWHRIIRHSLDNLKQHFRSSAVDKQES